MLKMQNIEKKRKSRMNIALVSQSMVLSRQINRLEVKKESSLLARERSQQRERDYSSRRSRSSSVKRHEQHQLMLK